MEESIQVQLYVFLFTLLGGLILGIVYDIIDVILYHKLNRKTGRAKTDILFWMLAIIIILSILFYSNSGIIRAYTLFGYIIGWLIYFLLFSRHIKKLVNILSYLITGFIRFIISIFLLPIGLLKRLLYKPYIRTRKRLINKKEKFKNYLRIPKTIVNQFEKYKKYLWKAKK